MNIESNTHSCKSSREEKPDPKALSEAVKPRAFFFSAMRLFWDAGLGRPFYTCLAGALAVGLFSGCANCGSCHSGGGSHSGCMSEGGRGGANSGAPDTGRGSCCSKNMESGYKK